MSDGRIDKAGRRAGSGSGTQVNFAPTISRVFEDGTPASVLLIRPGLDEQRYYGNYGFELIPVYDCGDYIDTASMVDDERPIGWIWMNAYGGVA